MESTSGTGRSATADLTSSRFQKTVCLYDWWLTKAAEGFEGNRLAVGGVAYQEDPNKSKHSRTRQVQRVFTSSPIIKRHDAFSLETSDGICVVIKGLINNDRTMGNGFSSEIFNHFVFGFPPEWKECGLKYMVEESVNGFASPQEVLEMSVPSSLNKETPINHSKVFSEERHDAQIQEECPQDVPGVNFDAEQKQNLGDIMNQNGDHRRKSKRLSQGPNCGDVKNQDEDCERNSNTSLKPPIETGKAISLPRLKQRCTIQEPSYNKTKRKKQSNHSKANTQVLKECLKHVPKAGIGEEIAEEGAQSTCEGLKQKGGTKQATPKSKIKRKINFDTPGKSVTEEAKESESMISPDAPSFKRSRSGRLLIPHMEYWRNQIPVYDRDRSITGILEDKTVTPLRGSRTEPPRKRR